MDAQPSTILIIDDSANIRSQIRDILTQHLPDSTLIEAADGIMGLKHALSQPFDLILCDLEMPGLDGFKFLATKNSREELRDTPLVILTSHERLHMKVKGLEEGASDYITKPFDTGEFLARIRVQLKLKHLQDELRKKNELLEQLSNTDHLTGIFNRRYLMTTMEKELQRSRRTNHPMSVIMADVDHFKKVNDTFGHQTGDAVLIAVSRALSENLREYDLLGRYGGEEFCIMLPGTDHKEGARIAERFRMAIERLDLTALMGKHRVTSSFGISTYPGSGKDTVDLLLSRADEALYKAKEAGRNRVVSK